MPKEIDNFGTGSRIPRGNQMMLETPSTIVPLEEWLEGMGAKARSGGGGASLNKEKVVEILEEYNIADSRLITKVLTANSDNGCSKAFKLLGRIFRAEHLTDASEEDKAKEIINDIAERLQIGGTGEGRHYS